jgi:hypothetical protein
VPAGTAIQRVALRATDTVALPSFDAATKSKDPRHEWFVMHYGRTCWELDAMSPVDLRARVRSEILARLDRPTWDRYVAAEEQERGSITLAVSTRNNLKSKIA